MDPEAPGVSETTSLGPRSLRKWAAPLSLLLIPIGLSLLLSTVPLIDSTVYDIIGVTNEIPWEGLLTTSAQGKIYRPLPFLQSKVFYALWGTTSAPYYLTAGMMLGLFTLLVYRFHLLLAPERRGTAFGASLLFAISTPVIYAMMKALDAEFMAGICLYAVLLVMERLREAPAARARRLWPLLTVATLAGSLSKETFLGMLPPILGAYVFWRWRQHRLSRSQKVGFVWAVAGYLLAIGLHLAFTPRLATDRAFEFSSSTSLLFAYHNLVQFSYPLLFASAAAIFLAALPRGRRAAGPLLLVLLLAAPLLIFVTYHETIFFTVESHSYRVFFGLLLLAGLGLRLARWDLTVEWFYSGAPLAVFIAMATFLSLVGLNRSITSTRTYIMVLPLIYWVLADSLARLRASGGAGTPTGGPSPPRDRMTRAVAAVLIVMVLYHTAAGSLNLTTRNMAEATALHPVRQALASQPLEGAALRQVNPWVVYIEELRGRGYSGTLPNFQSVTPDQPVSRAELRTTTYYYIEKTGPRVGWTSLRGDLPPDYFGVPTQLLGRFIHTREMPLETSLATLVRLEERRALFLQLSPWLEDTPLRLLSGVPWVEEYEALHGLYRVPSNP
ncbi:MAG: hypothetical protein HY558_03975 [Euryarchaeota archaeon]|nr:hypothetical protein [Euryarchaeota archaeon]